MTVSTPLDVRQHLVVPEAKDPIAAGSKPRVTGSVSGRICVLAAIDLDDEAPLPTNEIADIWTDWLLPNELATRELSAAKMPPELGFRVGLI